MPKPVLSDSLFNADDVATAVLAEANLQVANSSLGVVDKTSIFVASSNASIISSYSGGCYSFNGFMFVNLKFKYTGTFTNGDSLDLTTITDSNFYPIAKTTFPSISFEGDYVDLIEIDTNGTIRSISSQNSGNNTFYAVINGFYRYA